MFYSPAILAKKGELSKIWIAAHWQEKLSKQQAMSVDIAESCKAIKEPKVQLSLRLSGQLLHGVARIHQKKVTYLLQECSDALLKIKMAFRPGVVNLSIQETAATPSKINAPSIGNANHADMMMTETGDFPSPAAPTRSAIKNRFAGVEPKLDQDDWMKLTPVNVGPRKSTLRATPTIDDSDAKSTTTMDDKEENWSEFPFTSSVSGMGDDGSSIEIVRKQDDTKSDVMSEQQQQYQPYEYEDVGFGGGGDDFQPTAGGASYSKNSSVGGVDEGLMLSGLNKSWVEDAAMRENEEEQENKATTTATPGKKQQQVKKTDKKAGGGSATKRRRKIETITELSNEQLSEQLQDASSIMVERPNPRDRLAHEGSLRAQGFDVRTSMLGFESALERPASSTSGMHPRLVQLFKQNAQAVSSDKHGAQAYEHEDDIEVVRAATLTTDDSGTGAGGMPQDDLPAYQYEEAADYGGGGEDFRPSTTSGGMAEGFSGMNESNALPDELELTFQEDGAQPEGVSSTSPTRNSTRNTPTSGGRRSSGMATGTDGEKWHPQTIKMMKLLREKLTESPAITYQELADGQRKTIVAKAFFEVLQLSTRGMIQVAQSKPYGEIEITPGAKYENLLPGEST